MPVEFEDISVSFQAAGLLVPNLNVLEPDANPYDVLTIQPSGPLTFSQDFIGNENKEESEAKFSSFIDRAIATNADLVLSPEYSCPWASLEAALTNGKLPNLGKLWAFGCESITPSQLAELKLRIPGLTWICETPVIGARKFLDVVCYIMKTDAVAGGVKDVALLQFKTVPMGGGETFERDHMICGTKRYFLRNRAKDHLRFYTIICSEALEFDVNAGLAADLCQHPSIIFHPQMVKDSRHPGIRKYRADIYRHTCGKDVEVFSLNWARALKTVNAPVNAPPSVQGNSAVFMKSTRFDRSDAGIKKNHRQGIYYCRWEEHRADLCIFNFKEHIFYFTTQKVFLVGAEAQSRRTGPLIVDLWEWNQAGTVWKKCSEADDGFKLLCDSYATASLDICLSESSSAIDRERLLTLSAGTLRPALDWHLVEKMECFISEPDERSKRLTFVHELDADSVTFRNDHLTRFIQLQSKVLSNTTHFPANIADLKGNYQIAFPKAESNFRFNIFNKKTNESGATVIFLGVRPAAYAKAFLNELSKAWGEKDKKYREELTRRIVVTYEDANGVIRTEHPDLAKITDDSESPASIMSSEKL